MDLDTASCPMHSARKTCCPRFGVERGIRTTRPGGGSRGSVQIFGRSVNVKLRRSDSSRRKRSVVAALFATPIQLIVQNDRFSDIAHGPAPLLALPLQPSVSLFLGDL